MTLSVLTADEAHTAKITAAKIAVAERLTKKPIKAEAAVEGVLQMVDFTSLEFRIDRPPLPSVIVYFGEKHRDGVHAAVQEQDVSVYSLPSEIESDPWPVTTSKRRR